MHQLIRIHLALLLIFVLIGSIRSQLDTTLAETLLRNTYLLDLTDDGFQGDDALDQIDSAIVGSQFIMVGEQHGIKEVGHFTDRLYTLAQQEGYRHLALEVSPFMAQELEQRIKRGVDSLINLDKAMPFSIPFYNNRDDVQMLINALENPIADYWGLDQVFIVELRFLFHKLSRIAHSNVSRQLALEYFEKGKSMTEQAMQSGKFKEVLLFNLHPEDFSKLKAAFPKPDNLQAWEIINHIQKSQEIYQAWFEGRGYDNNLIRIELMKQNFYNYYHAATSGGELFPKVLFKFGSFHMGRGLTPVNMFDLGSLVHELSIQNEMHSVHFLFNAIRGSSFNPLQGAQTFDHWDDLDPHIQYAIEKKGTSDSWYLIDLRPIRQLRLKHTDADLRTRIFAFDFWVMVPEASPLTSF